ncbi:ATP-binding protein [Flavihumibacter sp. CACIAM 22H1]|uniref:sensor histidine kinase n=1 Tax=Flavihumibacter sp. CACIAM 22H1 TaxID=1812911 RepID=UPI0007A7E908|nr:ATP-binding protein [Flavihumibacter sp. CACIAM 22H1]KYP16299.1 MAG: hypothetical protein A1D16_20395 [Flavihumibacter sp. CACIAM 22H1]
MISIFQLYRIERKYQYLYSIGAVLLVAGGSFLFAEWIDYHIVAFLLLVTVSLAAVSFDIKPVLIAAVLSAVIWDLFFIPPRFSYAVTNPEDLALLLMYFVIVLINSVLTYRIRQVEILARQRAEKTREIQLYNAILNSLSHELRTPIATIMGATDNLLENSSVISETNKSILLTQISESATRLNQQVENLLNMSRLEAGQLKARPDWTDINELLHSLVRTSAGTATGHRISLSVAGNLPMVKLDKRMLEQALFNLLTNAQVHTPAGTFIELGSSYEHGWLSCWVEDNGPGFPMDEQELVFDRFYRLKNTSGSGTGLGLSIVKGFAEAMGGQVVLSSSLQAGSRFTITLPAPAAVNLPVHE